jgi:integrase
MLRNNDFLCKPFLSKKLCLPQFFSVFPALRMKILLALGTGLRRGDIESWKVSDLDFENSSVTTRSAKTRKSMGSRPVPVPIMAELKKYVSSLLQESYWKESQAKTFPS